MDFEKNNQSNLFNTPMETVPKTTPDGKEIIDFHNFNEEKIIKGIYLRPYQYEGTNSESSWKGHVFRLRTGSLRMVSDSYQIAKAIKGKEGHLIQIEFISKTELDDERSVNNYEIQMSKNPVVTIAKDDDLPF